MLVRRIHRQHTDRPIPVRLGPFADQVARASAYYETDRPIPMVALPHPMQNIDDDQLELRATLLADAAQRLLAGELP